MFRNFTIFSKLVISYLLLGIFTLVIVSVFFYQAFKTALIERTSAQLSSINVLKKDQIESYLHRIGYDSLSLPEPKKVTREVEDILFIRTGMGNTGESYIVGGDSTMRSKSRFFPDSTPSVIHVNTESTRLALAGREGVHLTRDYRNVEVLSAYRKLNIKGLNWVIISEIDFEEALMPVHKIRNYIILIGLIISLIIILITLYLSEKISNPILQLKTIILDLSKGVLPDKKISPSSHDEIGQMTEAINKLIEGLKRTSDFAYHIGSNDFNKSFQPLSDNDVLGISLLQMRDKLKIIQKKEISFIRARSSALLEGQENERKRLARELHDGLGQMLTVVKLRLNSVQTDQQLHEITSLLDETIAEVRRISNNLMPNVLLDFGLEAGLRLLCKNTSVHAGIDIEFCFDQTEVTPVNFEVSIGLYRIAQEGLNNIIKYADARKARLSVLQYKDRINMEISDEGKGFVLNEYYADSKERKGIKNMRERTKILNGTFHIESLLNKGTTITVEIPL
ncbi:MAG TPA: histidine kinase [Cytophagaceae bacterium]|nr:histidine kinase [Cytophagaceae bacterium]